MAQGVVGSADAEELWTPVSSWRAADLYLVEVTESEAAASDPHKSEREMAVCGMRHIS